MQQGWERRVPLIDLSRERAEALLRPVFPGSRVAMLIPLSGGLRNTLYRVEVEGRAAPVVLRLFTADPSACAREAALARLLDGEIPLPELLYADSRADPPYAIIAWCDGLPFTELIARGDREAIGSAARSAGSILASIQRHTFSGSGELGPDLTIVAPLPGGGAGFAEFIGQMAQRPRTRRRLGEELVHGVRRLVRQRRGALEDEQHAPVLMHADYKPENLLLRDKGDGWRVAAVLDWEFACSASRLFDPGLFLRRAHLLPPAYGDGFAAAFAADSGPLPSDWRERARLHDFVNLLDFLDLPDERPVLFSDVRALVAESIAALSR